MHSHVQRSAVLGSELALSVLPYTYMCEHAVPARVKLDQNSAYNKRHLQLTWTVTGGVDLVASNGACAAFMHFDQQQAVREACTQSHGVVTPTEAQYEWFPQVEGALSCLSRPETASSRSARIRQCRQAHYAEAASDDGGNKADRRAAKWDVQAHTGACSAAVQ